MTQMIAHYTIADYDQFRAAFDSDTEDRGNSGLSLLQLWREDDRNIWALYTVHDQFIAKEYLHGAAGVFNSQAGVLSTSFHYVETA